MSLFCDAVKLVRDSLILFRLLLRYFGQDWSRAQSRAYSPHCVSNELFEGQALHAVLGNAVHCCLGLSSPWVVSIYACADH